MSLMNHAPGEMDYGSLKFMSNMLVFKEIPCLLFAICYKVDLLLHLYMPSRKIIRPLCRPFCMPVNACYKYGSTVFGK